MEDGGGARGGGAGPGGHVFKGIRVAPTVGGGRTRRAWRTWRTWNAEHTEDMEVAEDKKVVILIML